MRPLRIAGLGLGAAPPPGVGGYLRLGWSISRYARAYTERAVAAFPGVEIVAHFHDTRGAGVANTWAAVLAGATSVDVCLGGIGGEPSSVEQHHVGETGNVCTEDLVVLLERAGIGTGVDVEAILIAGRRAEAVPDAPGRSQGLRTGHGLP